MKHGLPIFLLSLSTLAAQNRYEDLLPVSPNDPSMAALSTWRENIVGRYKSDGAVVPEFRSWFEIPFVAPKKLFQNLRFFTTDWSERFEPGKTTLAASGPGSGIEYTVVCDIDGKFVTDMFHGSGDHVSNLLIANKVGIRSAEDARLIWDAYCDIHQFHWKDRSLKKISDNTWRFYDDTIGDYHCYYDAVLDENGVITSFTSRADGVKAPANK